MVDLAPGIRGIKSETDTTIWFAYIEAVDRGSTAFIRFAASLPRDKTIRTSIMLEPRMAPAFRRYGFIPDPDRRGCWLRNATLDSYHHGSRHEV